MNEKAEEPEEENTPGATTHQKDSLEGTSHDTPIDESLKDPTNSASHLTPGEPIPCESCGETASLAYWKKRETEGGRNEDIFRNYCEICNMFSGICSKKVRGSLVFVTEEGRVLTLAEKMEWMRAEKRKRSDSRKTSDDQEMESVNSDTSTNGNSEEKEPSEEKIPENEEVKKKIPAQKRMKIRKGSNKHWTQRKKRVIRKASVEKEEQPSCSYETSSPTRGIKVPTIKDAKKLVTKMPPKPKKTDQPEEQTKSRSNRPSSITKKTSLSSIENVVLTADIEVQTDSDTLLKSNYVEEMIDTAIREGASQQIAIRLSQQPMLLRKQFVMMMKTIQDQEKKIDVYQAKEERYLEVAAKIADFGRTTRLEFSDSYRHIRADLIQRKEEFKAHGSEVAAVLKKEREKQKEMKKLMEQQADGHKVLQRNLEAKIAFLTEESAFERERADYFERTSRVCEKEKNEAKLTAEKAVANLNDRLFVANNERCARCTAVENVRKKMTVEVAEMTKKTEAATAERSEAVKKAALFESAAQKLGRDCDSLKYERDSWKAYAERFKKDISKLQQTLKEREAELAEKADYIVTPRSYSATPRSVACTPGEADQRTFPLEEGEILDTPPQASPRFGSSSNGRPLSKPFTQKIAEKKTSVPVASGFASWIPKETLNAPAPDVPKSLSAFGPPIKTPQQVEEERRSRLASFHDTPWGRANEGPSSAPMSASLADALSKAHAEKFLGPNDKAPNHTSKSYTDEVSRLMNANRKRTSESIDDQKKTSLQAFPSNSSTKKQKTEANRGSDQTNTTNSPQKIAPAASQKVISDVPSKQASAVTKQSAATSTTSSISSLASMKKIPKLSEKPPQPEFAPALGIVDPNEDSSIPGLGMLDELPKKAEVVGRKILPAEPKQQKTPNLPKQSVPGQKQSAPSAQKQSTPASVPKPSSKPTPTSSTLKPAEIQPAVKKNTSQQSQKNNGPSKRNDHQKKSTTNPFSNHNPWGTGDFWDTQDTRNSWNDKGARNFWDDRDPRDPRDSRSQGSSWVRPSHQLQPNHNQYGIQSNAQSTFDMNYGVDRAWSTGSTTSSSSLSFARDKEPLPWHRDYETPFGKVPVQDYFSSGRQPPQQNHSHSSFYSPSSRDNYGGGGGGYHTSGNPRSFYG